MVNPFFLAEFNPPILGVGNVVSVLTVVGNMEPHLFEFWGAEDVRNTFFVDPTHNVTKVSFFIGLCGPCITMPKKKDVIFLHICMELFIVHMIVCGEVVEVDNGGV